MTEKIVPPFRVDEYIDGESQIDLCIRDANQEPIVLIDPCINKDRTFAKALRDVMNENYKRICHAANGEEVADALDTGAFVEATHKREVAISKTDTTTKVGVAENATTTGDAAKMREACEMFVKAMEYEKCIHETMLAEAYQKAKAALAEPPRNCDIGTWQEQRDRMLLSCRRMEKSLPRWCEDNNCIDCALSWAQYPYPEGGAK